MEEKKKTLSLKEKLKRSQVQCEYIKKNYRRFDFKLHNTYDADMIAFVESKKNMQSYFKELIKKDMENYSKNEVEK